MNGMEKLPFYDDYMLLVEGKRVAMEVNLITLHVEDAVALCAVASRDDVLDVCLYVVGGKIGKKAESARVDTNYGNVLVSYFACRVKEGAVSADTHSEVVGPYDFALRHVYFWLAAKEVVERLMYG